MGFIQDLFGKEPQSITLDDVDSLIDVREEDRHLEFKAPAILGAPEKLSQVISAFLNADGGLIVLGLCEDNPDEKKKLDARIYATRREFVTKEYTKERIEQLIYSKISSFSKPRIDICPVRDPNDASNAVYLIDIAQGENPPYQAADGKYYRKLNATKYPMTHSEIADFFGRRRRPLLDLDFEFTKVNVEDMAFDLKVFIRNGGNAVAKNARVIASFVNLHIVGTGRGRALRIDDIRDDIPSIQWDLTSGVIYPHPSRTRIWDLQLRYVNKDTACSISWMINAEDMEMINYTADLSPSDLQEAKAMLDRGEKPMLYRSNPPKL